MIALCHALVFYFLSSLFIFCTSLANSTKDKLSGIVGLIVIVLMTISTVSLSADYIHKYIYIYIYTYTHKCVCIYLHTFTYICTHCKIMGKDNRLILASIVSRSYQHWF